MRANTYYEPLSEEYDPQDKELEHKLMPLVVEKLKELGLSIHVKDWKTIVVNVEPISRGKISEIVMEPKLHGELNKVDFVARPVPKSRRRVLNFKTA